MITDDLKKGDIPHFYVKSSEGTNLLVSCDSDGIFMVCLWDFVGYV